MEKEEIKNIFLNDDGWRKLEAAMQENCGRWQKQTREKLLQLMPGVHPKEVIHKIAENLLRHFEEKTLLDRYDLYQHLMNYWNDVLQDDLYFIAAEGWKAEVYRILVETKKGKTVDKGWACDLVPGWLVINRYFAAEKQELDDMEARKETLAAELEELEDEHSGEEGFFADMEKVNKAAVQKRLKELKPRQKKLVKLKETTVATVTEEDEEAAELKVLEQYMAVADELATLNSKSKQAAADLDKKVLAKYKDLNEGDIKTLVVDDKWLASLQQDFDGELQRIPQAFTQRVKELADRYETTLPQINAEVQALEEKVNAHLEKMGFAWR